MMLSIGCAEIVYRLQPIVLIIGPISRMALILVQL